MKLIEITRLLPLRNEKGEIYKWESSEEMIQPINIIRVRKEPAFEYPIISMRGGMEIIVEDTMKSFAKKHEEAWK